MFNSSQLKIKGSGQKENLSADKVETILVICIPYIGIKHHQSCAGKIYVIKLATTYNLQLGENQYFQNYERKAHYSHIPLDYDTQQARGNTPPQLLRLVLSSCYSLAYIFLKILLTKSWTVGLSLAIHPVLFGLALVKGQGPTHV